MELVFCGIKEGREKERERVVSSPFIVKLQSKGRMESKSASCNDSFAEEELSRFFGRICYESQRE